MDPVAQRRTGFTLFLIAVALYAAAFLVCGHLGTEPGDTVNFYVPVAQSILAGHGYMLDGELAARYPPVFPYFLASVFRISATPDLTNPFYPWLMLVVQALSVAWCFRAAGEWLTRRQSVVAALLLMTHPIFATFSVTLFAWNATPIFLCSFTLSLWMVLVAARSHRMSVCVVSGVALAIAVLTWPAPALLWLVYLIFILVASPEVSLRVRVRAALAFCASFAVPVGAWMLVVHHDTGTYAISTGLYPSMVHGLTYSLQDLAMGQRAQEALAQRQLMDVASVLLFYARELGSHPMDAIVFVTMKAGRAWYASISGSHDAITGWVQLPYAALAIHGVRRCLRRDRQRTWFLLGVAAYFWTVSISVLAVVRYMMPALCVALMYAAVGAEDVCRRLPRAFRQPVQKLDALLR